MARRKHSGAHPASSINGSREVIVLGGRRFVPIGSVTTIERDDWIMGQVQLAGLDQIEMGPGESIEDFGRRLLAATQSSNQACELAGAFIVPEGLAPTEWTPTVAIETGALLRKLTDPEEKLLRNRILIEMLIGFFVSGLSSLTTSASASAGVEGGPEPSAMSGATSPTVHGA